MQKGEIKHHDYQRIEKIQKENNRERTVEIASHYN
jgi:hypothetical protein